MNIQEINYLGLDSNLEVLRALLDFFSRRTLILKKDIYKSIQTLIDINEPDIDIIVKYLIYQNLCSDIDDKYVFKINDTEKVLYNFRKSILIEIFSVSDIKEALLNHSSFLVQNEKILIGLNSIDLKYRKYLIMLQKLNFLIPHKQEHYFEVIDYTIAKQLLTRPLKRLSLKDFKKIQRKKEMMGELAEEFVLRSENNKLENSAKYPKQISHVNVNAGYDIVSYDEYGKEIYIEVKGFQNNYSFHWSENEINISKNLSDKYFIYCIRFENDKPVEIYNKIQNPYEVIINKGKFNYKIKKDFLVKLN